MNLTLDTTPGLHNPDQLVHRISLCPLTDIFNTKLEKAIKRNQNARHQTIKWVRNLESPQFSWLSPTGVPSIPLSEWDGRTNHSLWGGLHVTQLPGHHARCISYEERPLELGNATSGLRNFPFLLGDFLWCSPPWFFSPAFFRLGTVTLNQDEAGRASSPKYLCWSLFPPDDVFVGNFPKCQLL